MAEALGLKTAADRAAIAKAAAWQALRHGDHACALALTLRLVAERHGPAWSLCEALLAPHLAAVQTPTGGVAAGGGQSSRQERDGAAAAAGVPAYDAATREKLLSHMLAHCPPERFDAAMELWRRWSQQHATVSLCAQADAALAEGDEEAVRDVMMDTAALHQDYQTLHEIHKALGRGLSFRQWMEENEAADVTADGFTERVNSADFRARYWLEAGGTFTASERAHLDRTRSAQPPADKEERVRRRRVFSGKSITRRAIRHAATGMGLW